MRKDRILAIAKKELYEGVRTLRYPFCLGIIAVLSVLSGVGGAQYILFLQNQNSPNAGTTPQPINYGALFGLTESRGLSLAELAVLYSPVIAFFLSADLVNKERDSGTLLKLLSKPIRRSEIFGGKSLALIAIIAAMGVLGPTLSFFSLWVILRGIVLFDDVARLAIFTLVYVLYLLTWGMIGLSYSIIFKKAVSSYLTSILSFLILSLLWVSISNVMASLTAGNVLQLESEQYMFRMLSITYVFSEAALFLLNSHYLSVNGGQYTFDWYKSISSLQSLYGVWMDISALCAVFAILWVINFRFFYKLNVTPRD